MNTTIEERLYKEGFWFDGVRWSKVDTKILTPEDRLKRRFRRLKEKNKSIVYNKGFVSLEVFDAFREFMFSRWKFNTYHIESFVYWLKHPLVKVIDVYKEGKVLGYCVDIEYKDIVVAQACIPVSVNVDLFYKNEVGHYTAITNPKYYNKTYFVGYGECYNYKEEKK